MSRYNGSRHERQPARRRWQVQASLFGRPVPLPVAIFAFGVLWGLATVCLVLLVQWVWPG